ncbi:hypothetical protein BELL_1156g00010 [Botrytis elliptica]|uniref:Uncharacterized protein n=1 Tax=Botrytis elliptica TaxID=278938 RepID=A0A4Z1IQE6_9HELO|nr:hypothetical protein BELL_1156g00010 [Botrytis elliptica]
MYSEQRKRSHEYANTSISSKAPTSSPSTRSSHFRSKPEVAIPIMHTGRATTSSTTPLSPPMTPLPTRLVPIMTQMLTVSPFGISIPIVDRLGGLGLELRASQDRVLQGQDQAQTSFQPQTRSQAQSSEQRKREQNPLEDASLRAHIYGILRGLNPGMTDEKIWEGDWGGLKRKVV